MKHLWLAAFLCFAASPVYAGGCNDPGTIHKSAVVNIGAATTTVIVPAVTNQRIYLCSILASLAGTTPTITLVYGTRVSADCDTGAVSLTGAIAGSGSGTLLPIGYGSDVVIVPPGNQLCGTTAGSGSSFQGIATYVQK